MTEAILGALIAVGAWIVLDLIVGSMVGELLLRPMHVLLGPPVGKFVVGLSWCVVAVIAWMAYDRAAPHWSDAWVWMTFLIASILSSLAVVCHKEEHRLR